MKLTIDKALSNYILKNSFLDVDSTQMTAELWFEQTQNIQTQRFQDDGFASPKPWAANPAGIGSSGFMAGNNSTS